jgi:hypothetical protein
VSKPTVVYRFFDAEDQLLYVGISDTHRTRWYGHVSKPWWALAVRHTLDWFDDRAEAEAEETRAIREESPIYNIAGTHAHTTPLAANGWGRQYELVGAAEIQAFLQVSRQRVQQIIRKPHFPVPYCELDMGKVWLPDDIEAWAAIHRPPAQAS